jgi:hypothetical protein
MVPFSQTSRAVPGYLAFENDRVTLSGRMFRQIQAEVLLESILAVFKEALHKGLIDDRNGSGSLVIRSREGSTSNHHVGSNRLPE